MCFLVAGQYMSIDWLHPTHFLRLLSPITHLIPSIVQFEQVTSPSAVMWYRCITSQRTFRARQAAHAFVALLFTGLGLPLASSAAAALERFCTSGEGGAGDLEAVRSLDGSPSEVMRGEGRGYTCEPRKSRYVIGVASPTRRAAGRITNSQHDDKSKYGAAK